MPVATFDTLKYANDLKAVGVPDKQAEAQARVLSEALQINLKDLATKDDLEKMATKDDFKELAASIRVLDERIGHIRDLFKWRIGVVIAINLATFAFLLRLVFVH